MVLPPAFGGLETDNAVDPPTTNVHKCTAACSWSIKQPHVDCHSHSLLIPEPGNEPLEQALPALRETTDTADPWWFGGLDKAPGLHFFYGPSSSNFRMPVRPVPIDRAKPNAASNPLKPKPTTTRSTRHKTFTPKMPIFRLPDRSLPNLFNVSMREQSVHTQCTQSQPRNPLEPPQDPASEYQNHRNPTEHFTLPPRSFLHSVISGEQASKEGWKREEIEGQYALLSVCHPRVEL